MLVKMVEVGVKFYSNAHQSAERSFNVRHISAKPLQSLADIIPQSQYGKVIQWTLPCGNAEQYDVGFIIPQIKSSKVIQ